MREDMAKVVTERPRRGHANKSKKTAAKIPPAKFDSDDHGSTRAPVSRHRQYGYNAKEFSDLIGPLRKFLRAQVGRPWNKINSEISKTLDKRSMAGRHILEHVGWEVAKNCELRADGKIYDLSRSTPTYLHQVAGLYVHPRTGLLCLAEKVKRARKAKPVDLIPLVDGTSLRLLEGIWFLCRYIKVTRPEWVLVNGKWLRAARESTRELKRQLNKKELKYHGLSNSMETAPE